MYRLPEPVVRTTTRPPPVLAHMCLLSENLQCPLQARRSGLYKASHRRGKKREEEGVEILPRTTQQTSGDYTQCSHTGKQGGYFVAKQQNNNSEPHPRVTNIVTNTVGQGHAPENAQPHIANNTQESPDAGPPEDNSSQMTNANYSHNAHLRAIYEAVINGGTYNHQGARRRVPSGLCIEAWRKHLSDYTDHNLVDFLAYGWPVNYHRTSPLVATTSNHPSALAHDRDVDFYVNTELSFGALAGPFAGPPVTQCHTSPLMTKPKKDSNHRRVIVDLSWPDGAAVNDGIPTDLYVDGLAHTTLPTVEFMESRLLHFGRGAFLYKMDLARGYRQLRVHPGDWPLLGFKHRGEWFMDICPPFGLRTSALFMQRTSEAICHVHRKAGYVSRPYLDDFRGAEATEERAGAALGKLRDIMNELGVQPAEHKTRGPTQAMVWLGLHYDTLSMTISIPKPKMEEIMQLLAEWEGRERATLTQLQSLIGTLQFVAGVSPPTRIFTNRMLQTLREAPKRGTESLSWGFKRDLAFFLALLPAFNGVRIVDKTSISYQDHLELDACLTGCGACTDSLYYAREFPAWVQQKEHTIAHLELLNIVVALKVWRRQWAGHRVCVWSDNANACIAVQTGRTKDYYMQDCIREIFLYTAAEDIELHVLHRPGVELQRADALSRAHTQAHYRDWIARDPVLMNATEVAVPDNYFILDNKL